jgi:hypothetical protein
MINHLSMLKPEILSTRMKLLLSNPTKSIKIAVREAQEKQIVLLLKVLDGRNKEHCLIIRVSDDIEHVLLLDLPLHVWRDDQIPDELSIHEEGVDKNGQDDDISVDFPHF